MKFFSLLTKLSVGELILIPLSLSALLIVVLVSTTDSSKTFHDMLVFLILFAWGAVGVPIVVRKETPTILKPIQGWLAIVQGGFIMLAFWLPAILITIGMLRN